MAVRIRFQADVNTPQGTTSEHVERLIFQSDLPGGAGPPRCGRLSLYTLSRAHLLSCLLLAHVKMGASPSLHVTCCETVSTLLAHVYLLNEVALLTPIFTFFLFYSRLLVHLASSSTLTPLFEPKTLHSQVPKMKEERESSLSS